MVDRDNEQARLFIGSAGTKEVLGRDALIAVGLGLLVAVGFTVSGSPKSLAEKVGSAEPWLASIMIGAAACLIITLVLFARRRYKEARIAQLALNDLSFTDGLTGLPNRRFLGEPFEEILVRARRQNGRIAVLFMALDGLESINENYGHAAGDTLVTTIVDRMRDQLGPDDTLCRYGGAEFVIILTSVTTAASAERVARRLLETCQTPIDFGEDSRTISTIIGISITEDRPARAGEILSDAEAAMRQARLSGKGHYAIFDRSLHELMTPARAERKLRQAVENGEFRLYYQPIVSLWTKRLVGVEALLRWNASEKGAVSPDDFLPALEESGLIVPVGNWVLNEVCRQAHTWNSDFPDYPALSIKVNISVRQLSQANFASQLRETIERTGIDADRLFLDVQGNSSTEQQNAVFTSLGDLKAIGVNLSMDDFGSGHTSLGDLRRLGLEMLSINKAFVGGLGASNEDTKIVEHVIGIAKALGIVTVAEGVETEQQVNLLRQMNCDLAQGWYFSHPQPPDVISQLLASAGSRHEWQPPEAPLDESAAPVVHLDRFNHTDSRH